MPNIRLALCLVLSASLLALSGCLLPLSVEPSKSLPWDLAALNRAVQTPGFQLPKEPVIVTGEVISVYHGSRYSQVLSLAPVGVSPASRKEVMLCLFETPARAVRPGAVITVAGYLDRSSAPGNLVMTAATFADR